MKKADQRREEIRAEAAAWIARLQTVEDRDANVVRGLKQWLGEDPRHREAFDQATCLWDVLAGAEAIRAARPPAPRRIRWHRPMLGALATLLVVISAVLGKPYLLPDRYETGVGEQRVVQLREGSEVVLNTDSAVEVSYRWRSRQMRLLRGEALFRIAPDPERPLQVHHRHGRIDVLGTTFLVHDEPERSSVTLLEGQVTVQNHLVGRGEESRIDLRPGQRLTTKPNRGASIDYPSLSAVTAWQRRQLLLDDVSLQDAVYEMNRYQPRTRVRVDPDIAGLRLSGVFSSQRPREFSMAIAALHDLVIEEDGTSIHLHRRPEE